MCPVFEAKMNSACPCAVPDRTTKSVVGLKTCPVGAPPGMLTVSGNLTNAEPLTSPVYRVLTPVPPAETQKAPVVALSETPRALTRAGSWMRATPASLATRLVCWKNPGDADSKLRLSRASRAGRKARPSGRERAGRLSQLCMDHLRGETMTPRDTPRGVA